METSAIYRYITTDLLTGTVLSEIPIHGVSWGRAVRRAGEFRGSIPVIAATKHLNLYDSTIPGRTALYVLRNDVCVWGGIIWSREYSADNRTLDISGAEFISYFYHRFVWKSLLDQATGLGLYAMTAPIQIGAYSLVSGVATIETRSIDLEEGSQPRPHLLTKGDEIVLSGIDSRLEGGAVVDSIVSDTTFTFITDSIDTISRTETTLAVFQKSMDNYRFVRDLISRTAEDFAGIEIKRDEYLPGETLRLSIVQKERLSNVATITTSEPHYLITGQEAVVKDVDNEFDGRHTVTSITSPYAFQYDNSYGDLAATAEDGIRTLNITEFSVVGKVVTLTTEVAHNASVGDEVVVDAGRKQTDATKAMPDMDIFDETQDIKTIESATKFTYERSTYSNSYWYFQRNIVSAGIDYQASPEKWVVTIEVDADHNYLLGASVQVIGLGFPYDTPKDGSYKITALPSTKQFQYEISRSCKISKRVSTKAGVVTIYTDKAHGFRPGDTIVISNYGAVSSKGYNGTWVIDQTPSAYRFTFKKEKTVKVRGEYSKASKTVTILGGDDMSALEVGMGVTVTGGGGIGAGAKITAVNTGSSTVTISDDTTAAAQQVTASSTAAVDSNTLSVSQADAKLIKTGMIVSGTGIQTGTKVTGVNTTTNKVSISLKTTAAISGANLKYSPQLTFSIKYLDTPGTDSSPPATATVKDTSDYAFDKINKSNGEIISRTDRILIKGGGTVLLGPRAYVGSYGGYAFNSDIGITYGEETNAGVYTYKNDFVGSNLLSIGDVLEEVSAGPDGFEYRIDCSYDDKAQKFVREFVISGYDYPDDPEPGEVRSIESLGANKFIFEYPGNIASLRLRESAEESATRLWVTGANNASITGENARQPMSAATKQSMLEDGWPVLEATEQMDGEMGTARLYNHAKSFLEESLPPIDELTVEVNGSMDPQAGTYSPGDWCSLLFEDEFMKARLASKQEARDNIFVRKIYGFKVDVPDAFGIPEKVSLELIRDTEVDTYGNQQA